MLSVQTAAPELALRPYVRAYVQREARLGAKVLIEPVVARLGVMLEFEFAGSYEVRSYETDALNATFPATIIGPMTWRRARLIIRDHVEALVVMFQPAGFHALFGMPTAPFAQIGTEGHSVLGVGVSRLRERLGNAESFAERARMLDSYLLCQLRNMQTVDPVYRALHLLTIGGAGLRVEDVARQMGVNRRSLERKALAYAGVSPKELTRISRFSRALQLRTAGSQSWTEIAHAAGYHDQMHMIRDFRVFAGDAPTSALQEIAPDHLIHFAVSEAGESTAAM
jgi:AraC-like DNA-binding protein